MTYFAGIDLGGTNIKGMLMDDRFQPLISRSSPTPWKMPPEVTFEAIIRLITGMAADSGSDLNQLAGIGIGIPGLIDSRSNLVYNAANLGWNHVDAGSTLREYFQKPIFTENDGNINALGEMQFGAGKGAKNIILLTLGTGLGSGIIVDGQILHGMSNVAAEAGHMVIETNGDRCACGKTGCFESCCSATAMLRYARRYAQDYPDTLLLQYAAGNLEAIDGQMIDRAFDAGDAAAQKVIATLSEKLSIGLVNLINLFNPETIIISGGVSKSGERILGPTRLRVEANLMHPVQRCNIIAGQLGTEAGVMGACYLAASGCSKDR